MRFHCITRCYRSDTRRTFREGTVYDLTDEEVKALGGQMKHFDPLGHEAEGAKKVALAKAAKEQKAKAAKASSSKDDTMAVQAVLARIEALVSHVEAAVDRAEAAADRAEAAVASLQADKKPGAESDAKDE